MRRDSGTARARRGPTRSLPLRSDGARTALVPAPDAGWARRAWPRLSRFQNTRTGPKIPSSHVQVQAVGSTGPGLADKTRLLRIGAGGSGPGPGRAPSSDPPAGRPVRQPLPLAQKHSESESRRRRRRGGFSTRHFPCGMPCPAGPLHAPPPRGPSRPRVKEGGGGELIAPVSRAELRARASVTVRRRGRGAPPTRATPAAHGTDTATVTQSPAGMARLRVGAKGP